MPFAHLLLLFGVLRAVPQAQELVSKCAASLQTLRKEGVSMDVVRVNSTDTVRNKATSSVIIRRPNDHLDYRHILIEIMIINDHIRYDDIIVSDDPIRDYVVCIYASKSSISYCITIDMRSEALGLFFFAVRGLYPLRRA